jgi:STE24 endopeptidase
VNKARLTLTALAIACAVNVSLAQEGPVPAARPLTAMPSVIKVPPEAQPSSHFDPETATKAYLAQIPADATARSNAYFEGGYWLLLWDFLVSVIIFILVLGLRWSAAMRNIAERSTRFKPMQTLVYWAQLSIVTFVLSFPMTVYEGYFREHQYGLATQTFGAWMSDQIKALVVSIVLGGVAVMFLVGVVRRLPNTWWIWGAVVSIIFVAFFALIAPVYVFPLFNKVTLLEDPKVTQPILSMARANGISADKVYQIDASRQTTRMSANVSGFGKTMRITLNDNLLGRGSPEEIQSIMGHEMGHYVLNHVYKDFMFMFLVIVIGFGSLRWALNWSLDRWEERWQIRGVGDTAILPLVFLLASGFFFVLTPILNTHVRTAEAEADMYGINASRQPDGFAQAAIHLGEYRKMNPGPLEEWIFFDHPSGRNRIYAAMRWKAENLRLFGPASP